MNNMTYENCFSSFEKSCEYMTFLFSLQELRENVIDIPCVVTMRNAMRVCRPRAEKRDRCLTHVILTYASTKEMKPTHGQTERAMTHAGRTNE